MITWSQSFQRGIKWAVKSQGTRQNKRMNIEAIENQRGRSLSNAFIKLAVKSQGTRQNKRMNIETIENG